MLHFECQPHTANKAIQSLYNELLLNDEQLNRRPAYQRNLAWDDEQKGYLIDSIVANCPITVFLLYMYDDVNECIDGQNRLTTIKDYIEQAPSDSSDPFAWIIYHEEDGKQWEEHVFYDNPKTREAMIAYCTSKSRPAKGRRIRKDFRLMTSQEMKRFNGYQCSLSEIKTRLTYEQRKNMFMRWQNGSSISQCDRFKNENHPFCKFATDQELQRTFASRISQLLKADSKNWLFDIYRMINAFVDGNTEANQVLLSTISVRTRIEKQEDSDFSVEIMKEAVKRAEKFLGKFAFLSKMKDDMTISFLLDLALLWTSAVDRPQLREVMENEEFLLKFAKESLDNKDMKHNTVNNGPQEKALIAAFPLFKQAFMVAYDEQKPSVPEQKYKKDNIPATRKTETWNAYIGESQGSADCLCCGLNKISARNFEAGHVIPEVDGGSIDVENLRPICKPCNGSMGSKNMIAYMKKMYPGKVLKGI